MIYFTKGQTNEIILTLKEKQTLDSPNFLFVFTHRGTNTIVKFVKLNNTDTSLYKDRFNSFSILTNTYFQSSQLGEWEYEIYEQTSSTNTDPSLATKLLETGIMRLNGDAMEYTQYETNNTFITR